MSQLAIAWCLKNAHVSTVILGASRMEQLKENLKSAEFATKLTPQVMTAIASAITLSPA
jgi:aryl-alcohol dehydrogenase-like predicted oxidoreductase